MANEITASASLAYNNPSTTSSPVGRSVNGLLANSLANLAPNGTTLSVATTGTTIPLGQIATPGWSWFRNLDSTNFVNIYTSLADKLLGANPFATLYPGEFWMGPLGTTTAPYAVANTAAVDLEYLICSR